MFKCSTLYTYWITQVSWQETEDSKKIFVSVWQINILDPLSSTPMIYQSNYPSTKNDMKKSMSFKYFLFLYNMRDII